ncbi:MAG: hypothetical protein HY465_04350, partial [Deltaproteobacteria bacterium]|nr:hypothetical protein [Deltaproteobacteria bacterium]
DGDTLCDGNCAGIGEDLNVNGIVDLDPQGRFLETNPRIADSDLDGCDDRCDMFAGGSFSRNNTPRATQGKASEGIFSCMNTIVPGATPDSTMALFGLILALNRFVVGRLRRRQ